jgi:hypothetical protein
MAGFANYGSYVDAIVNGQTSFCSFRKVPSQATVANWWVDLSMAAGNPPPNYYASEPLAAAVLEGHRGIYHGFDKTPNYEYLTRISLQTPTAGLVGQYMLLDYLVYYPFIDGDESDVQVMDNAVTLPRYTDGAGVQAMLVCVAPTAGGGQFTFDYVNQSGDTKTSPVHFYSTTAAGITSLLTAQPASAAASGPFLKLASGDSGIRSIVSFSNTVLNGGLGTLVLVKPIADLAIREINTPTEFSFAGQRSPGPRIVDGAYLHLIMNCAATVAAGTLTGFGQFVWG